MARGRVLARICLALGLAAGIAWAMTHRGTRQPFEAARTVGIGMVYRWNN